MNNSTEIKGHFCAVAPPDGGFVYCTSTILHLCHHFIYIYVAHQSIRYGWVIVFAAGMCILCIDGISYTFGVFIGEFADYFSVGRGTVAMAGSLQSGFYLCCGELFHISEKKKIPKRTLHYVEFSFDVCRSDCISVDQQIWMSHRVHCWMCTVVHCLCVEYIQQKHRISVACLWSAGRIELRTHLLAIRRCRRLLFRE